MKESAAVVVVGAGVIGCSTAYHLAQAGVSDVIILDQAHVGAGSSSKSAAMLTLQFCMDEITLRMAQYSYDRFMSFEDELGVSVDFRPIGWLYLATDASAAMLREQVAFLKKMGVNTKLLSPTEVAERYPELNTDDIVLGSWGPDDGPLDPHMVMWGYLKRARQMGVQLYEKTGVTDLFLQSGRVVGVQTEKGAIGCDIVINAAGPWATRIGHLVDVEIPLRNSARTIVVTDAIEQIPADRPFVEDLSTEWYFRPEVDGVLMGMGAKPALDADHVPLDEEQIGRIIDVAIHRVPALEKASMLTAWTGLRPLTPDGLPIVGKVQGVDGFLLNCGWGGLGIMMAPIAGKMICELVTGGSVESLDALPLQLSRFASSSSRRRGVEDRRAGV